MPRLFPLFQTDRPSPEDLAFQADAPGRPASVSRELPWGSLTSAVKGLLMRLGAGVTSIQAEEAPRRAHPSGSVVRRWGSTAAPAPSSGSGSYLPRDLTAPSLGFAPL